MNDLIDGVRPKIPNSIVIASDGTVYWTDSDTNFSLNDGLYTIFADGTGRLVKIHLYKYFNNYLNFLYKYLELYDPSNTYYYTLF